MATGTAIPTVPISTYLTQLGGGPSGGDVNENAASVADALTSQAGFLKADPNATINVEGASESQLSDAKSALLAGYTPQQVAAAVFSSNPIANTAKTVSGSTMQPTSDDTKAKPKSSDKKGFLGDIEGAAEDTWNDTNKAVDDLVTPGFVGEKVLPSIGKAKVSKDPKVKKKADTKDSTGDTSLSELATTLANEYAAQGIEQIGSEGAQLANENQAIMSQIMPSLTGSTAYNTGGSSSPDVQAAMDAYAKAYGTSEAFNSQAYTQSGIANEQYLASSPEAAYLQMLSQPGSEYYKDISPDLLKSLPESLQYALQQAELGGDYASGGLIATPKGGWPASVTGGAGGSAPTTDVGNALSALGTIPGSPTSPSSLSTSGTTGGGSNPGG